MRARDRIPDKEGKRAAIITLWLLVLVGPLLWLLWTLNQLNQGMQCFLGCWSVAPANCTNSAQV